MTSTTISRARFGIHSIDHFALDVPNLDEATRFLDAFGFRLEPRPGQLLLRTPGSDHVWARVREGGRKQLAYLALHCFADDFAPLCEQVLNAGGTAAEPARLAPDDGFWFHDPDGNLLQLKPGVKTSPGCKPVARREPAPLRSRGASARADAPPTRPTRLSHVLMFTPDVRQAVAFYERSLGLALSDGSEGIVAFLHARHGSDHHLVAFAQGAAKGWHHSAWDVATIDEVGVGKMQMQRAGYVEGWGVGRHVLGSNYFQYVRDPWGSYWEYSADIDYVGAGVEWPSGNHPPEDSLYLWGPDVPAYFFENTEA
ncbi:VOC family protein [Caballeronia ptereochthonis]|uniref:Glyoxalase/bleomycin resistance protein/dioxygenase n=1 Tax=Caballeronia ptereochthonis TaxID=1777144 RepID=A0A158C2A5_9BURK|nr:VOC family protein [Caballeronia ptereochthonis]SAK76452.1 glyoxalase/bleomycin resistance protein/dioxygenase [Caballeronia ptereochthonis]